VLLTQAASWTPTRSVAVIQALTPYLGLLVVPVAASALWRRDLRLAAVAGAVGAGMLVVAAPLALPADQPPARADAAGLTIVSANLLFLNDRVDDVAADLADRAPDVIVFNEYTPRHQATLLASPLADRYPERIDRPDRLSRGVAVWSRVPLTLRDAQPDTEHQSIDVDLDGPDGPLRLVALHVPTPIDDFTNWRRDLATLAEIGRAADGPTAIVGDLNATYWHPDFRAMLDAGLVDAHAATGRGFSTSWPTDRPLPAFARLDHALVTDDLVATAVDDVEIVGSDHLGLTVTVVPAR
jgi:endonuclease/exonuclease/phosphatase (EEP) superfamily protein YafD